MLVNTKYMVAVSRFITRLHTGHVAPEELTQIAHDTAAAFQGNNLVQSMAGLSLQDRQQERLDGKSSYWIIKYL